MKRFTGPYWLASGSSRRRELLTTAGVSITVLPADIDDGRLRPGNVPPEAWVMALAYLKARRVTEMLLTRAEPLRQGTVIAADTICVQDGALLGQPRDADHATAMIQSMSGREHVTMTGVAMIDLDTLGRWMFFDRAHVSVGNIEAQQIEQYVRSGEWRGKAGAYNLSERIAAGWPIRCEGDPATVMGLPMKRLTNLLARSGEGGT